jgi:hypothetical protein
MVGLRVFVGKGDLLGVNVTVGVSVAVNVGVNVSVGVLVGGIGVNVWVGGTGDEVIVFVGETAATTGTAVHEARISAVAV